MRAAIKNTNVVLDMAIVPGVILIPSKMVILKEPALPGYNNVLTLATKEMRFGENSNYNPIQDNVEEGKKEPVSHESEENEESNNVSDNDDDEPVKPRQTVNHVKL